MGFMRQLFGPSKEDVWQQLCDETGASLVEGSFWKGGKVQARVGEWAITLDIYTVPHGDKGSTTYTRIRAPYVNKDGFRFTIYRKGLFSGLGKLLGMQDIEVGHPQFDEDFIIKGNDEKKLRALFGNATLRQLLDLQPHVHLTVRDDEGWFEVLSEVVF
ncbi:MAG: DUF3137 domain-containing protein [Planctomycetaceae bacterium]|nr:DUF3137 domain-containing protein [Planctomycetaceae bacterium]